MNKYLAEFMGVFFWMLTLGCVFIAPAGGTIPAVAIGAVVAVMVALMWDVSGAHLNPAVSVAIWRSGLLPLKEMVPYVVFQSLGAGAAVAVVKVIKSGFRVGAMEPKALPAMLAEFLFTLLFCYTMIHLCKQREKASAVAGGVLTGGIIVAGIFAMTAVSGAFFNPATSLGACMVGALSFKSLLVYLLAQVAAGFVAPYAYRGLNPAENPPV